MITGTKHCQKCYEEMGYAQNVFVIPALNNPSGLSEPVSTTSGFPVVVFVCPSCNYVELYRKQI